MTVKRKFWILILLALVGAILLEAATKRKSMDAEGYVVLANQMGANGNHLEATEAFKNALKINPDYIPAYLGLGTAYGNTGHHDEAIAIFRQGIQLDPGHRSVPQMQMNIAVMAHNMKNGKVAVQYAKKALQSYTDQGNYAGVALAGQKLKQFMTIP
jgi:tetratricopeptide (TPR) repeat protein